MEGFSRRCLELANVLVYGMPVGAPPALWSEYLRCLLREIQALALQPADPDADGKITDEAPYASQLDDIVAGNPHSHPQLALADILGGALATAIHAMTRAKAQAGTFATEIIEADETKGLVFSRLWPEQDLDFLKLMRMNEPSVSDLSRSTLLPPPASGDGWFA